MGAITVTGLKSKDARVTTFVVEVYSDSGLTGLVDTGFAPAVFDNTTGLNQMFGSMLFREITEGDTYYLRSCTIVPGYGPSAWSSTFSIAAGADAGFGGGGGTGGDGYGATTGSNSNGYWVQDSNGYIRQWGVIATDINGGTVAVTFPKAFTDSTSISVDVSTKSSTDRITFVVDGSVSNTGFTVKNNGSSGFAYWSAEGYGAAALGVAAMVNPMAAKGDLIAGGASGAPDRLAVGTEGQVLTADSTATDGFTWKNPAGPAPVIGFQIVDGTPGTNVAGTAAAPRTGKITECLITVDASDATTALQFRIMQNGVDIFTSDPVVSAATTPGTQTSITLTITSNPLTVTKHDKFTLDILTGAATWKFTAQLD